MPERGLKSFNNLPWAAHAPTERHGEKQARSRAWMATGEPLLSSRPSYAGTSAFWAWISLTIDRIVATSVGTL